MQTHRPEWICFKIERATKCNSRTQLSNFIYVTKRRDDRRNSSWYTPYCCVSEHPLGLHAQLDLATEKKHKCPCTKQKLEGEIDKHLKIYIRLSLAGCNTPLLLVSGSLSWQARNNDWLFRNLTSSCIHWSFICFTRKYRLAFVSMLSDTRIEHTTWCYLLSRANKAVHYHSLPSDIQKRKHTCHT